MRLLPAILVSLSFGCATTSPQVIAFRDASVLSMTSPQPLAHQTVIVRGRTIESVSDAAQTAIPAGATVVDCSGQTLMPGLADAHAHLPGAEEPGPPMDEYLFLYLSRGVTTARAMRGDAQQLALSRRIERGEVSGPSLIVGSPAIYEHMTAEEAAKRISQYQRDGFAFIKYLGGTTAEEYDTLAFEAKKNGIRFMGHVPKEISIAHAIDSGQCDVEHLSPVIREYRKDPSSIEATIRMMADHQIAHTPDVVWYLIQFHQRDLQQLESTKGLQYIRQSLKKQWRDSIAKGLAEPEAGAVRTKWQADIADYRKLLPQMNAAGVPLLVSATAGEFVVPGFSMEDEMDVLAASGVPLYDVLRAATRNAADSVGQTDWGTIEPGKRADLLLLAKSPLEDIHNVGLVEGVMVRGAWMPKAEIDAKLAKLEKSAAVN